MKYTLTSLLLSSLFFFAYSQAPAPPVLLNSVTVTKIYIVRHADRTAGDDLTAAGMARANELKRVLGPSGIDSIFSKNFTRTKKTVKPLATFRGLPTIIYATEAEVVNRILTKSPGKRVLIAGHSNTVSGIITAFGGVPPAAINPNIPDNQFDNLFLILVKKTVINGVVSSSCEVIHMKYGAVTN